MVYVLLADGFCDTEAFAPVDILRRASADVKLVGVTGEQVTAFTGVTVLTDCRLDGVSIDDCEMLVLPGGGGGTKNLKASARVGELVRLAHDQGKWLAAICAAPTILAGLGLLNGRNAVCYPGDAEELTQNGALVVESESVVVDGRIITARAAGSSLDFGLKLAEVLKGREAAEEIRRRIYYKTPGG